MLPQQKLHDTELMRFPSLVVHLAVMDNRQATCFVQMSDVFVQSQVTPSLTTNFSGREIRVVRQSDL